jgi:hypothetical protein
MLEGNIAEFFGYGIGRVDNIGAVTRITFYAPTKLDGAYVSEARLALDRSD